MTNRRTFIASIGAVGTVAIAGCSSIIGGGPEGAVEQYFEAAKEGDVEKANEVVYTEEYSLGEEDLESTIELVNTEELSSAELAEKETFNTESEEELESIKEELKSETGADEVAWVLVEYKQSGETEEQPLPVIKVDGDWKIHFF